MIIILVRECKICKGDLPPKASSYCKKCYPAYRKEYNRVLMAKKTKDKSKKAKEKPYTLKQLKDLVNDSTTVVNVKRIRKTSYSKLGKNNNGKKVRKK